MFNLWSLTLREHMWQRRPSSPSYSRDPLPQNAESQMRTPLGNLREIHTDANELTVEWVWIVWMFLITFNATVGKSGMNVWMLLTYSKCHLRKSLLTDSKLRSRWSRCFNCLYSSHPTLQQPPDISISISHSHLASFCFGGLGTYFLSGSVVTAVASMLVLMLMPISALLLNHIQFFCVTFNDRKVHHLLNTFSPALAGHTTSAGCQLWK